MLDSQGQSPVDLVHLILHQSSLLGWIHSVPLGDIPPQLSVSVPFSKPTDPSTRDSAITRLRNTYAFPLQVLAPPTPKGGVAIERPVHTHLSRRQAPQACSAGVSYSSSSSHRRAPPPKKFPTSLFLHPSLSITPWSQLSNAAEDALSSSPRPGRWIGETSVELTPNHPAVGSALQVDQANNSLFLVLASESISRLPTLSLLSPEHRLTCTRPRSPTATPRIQHPTQASQPDTQLSQSPPGIWTVE